MARGKEGPEMASILCNRALCYYRMDLPRKALKVYNYRKLITLKGKLLCEKLLSLSVPSPKTYNKPVSIAPLLSRSIEPCQEDLINLPRPFLEMKNLFSKSL